MNLTKEQRGEMSPEEKVGGVSEGEVKLSDDNKPSVMGNDNDTYLKVPFASFFFICLDPYSSILRIVFGES